MWNPSNSCGIRSAIICRTGRRGHSCSRPAQLHQLKLPTGYQTLPSQIPPRRGFNKPHSYYDAWTKEKNREKGRVEQLTQRRLSCQS
uniref:Uncharacterized protein n=1 Tax=Heterorhabditis bacteriophora TaxID=37862 RepID=A0A1I7WKZ6_HETBA